MGSSTLLLTVLVLCAVIYIVDSSTLWIKNWNCNLRNLFGVHLNVKKMLNEIDINRNGKITVGEDKDSYALYDPNGDGKVTRFEYVNRLMNEFCYPKEAASQLFDMFDVNKDDLLTHEDTDPKAPVFDANGDADVGYMTKGLQKHDIKAQQQVRDREYIRELIKQTYDG